MGNIKDAWKKYCRDRECFPWDESSARAGINVDDNKHSKCRAPVGWCGFEIADIIRALNNQGGKATARVTRERVGVLGVLCTPRDAQAFSRRRHRLLLQWPAVGVLDWESPLRQPAEMKRQVALERPPE